MILNLLDQLRGFSKKLAKVKAVNVNSKSLKEEALSLASSYFSEGRQDALGLLGDTDRLDALDRSWQHLIRLAQGNNAKSTYRRITGELTKALQDLEVRQRSTVIDQTSETRHGSTTESETRLITTLDSLVPSAALSYRQGVSDLVDRDRLSYRGTAAEFRESLREALDHLAPDMDVTAEDWYVPEHGQKKPTMKQKVRYILGSRERKKAQRVAAEKTVDLVENLAGDVARAVYNRASLSAHVHTTRDEVQQLKRYLDALLYDLLEIG